MVGRGINNLDMSLFRKFHVGLGESRYFEFRAESFNLFNNVQFGVPNTSLNAPLDALEIRLSERSPASRTRRVELQMGLKFNY